MVQIPEEILEEYEKWYVFLQEKVRFQMSKSLFHTRDHCARVLLFALLLANREDWTPEERDILAAAAVFHDSCRKDDGYDVGHGRRGAEAYWDFCMSKRLPFSEICYRILEYHDREDKLGEKALAIMGKEGERGIRLYRIFKDADALDRYRLGPGQGELDVKYLRTDAAKELTGYAKRVVESWNGES